MKIKLLSVALRDLADGQDFYERQSPGLGNYFLDSLYSDIESLALYAGIHRKFRGYHRLLSQRFPYAIYYKTNASLVEVWRVLDCRRDPQRTFADLGED
jgi:plasmid stabilization system protein ParE